MRTMSEGNEPLQRIIASRFQSIGTVRSTHLLFDNLVLQLELKFWRHCRNQQNNTVQYLKSMSARRPKKPNEKSDQDVIAKLQEDLKQSKLRIETLERFLVLRNEQTHRAKKDEQEMKDKLRQLDEDFEKEKVERFNIASDMIRQYKSMQETMISRLNDSEKKRANLKDQLGPYQHAYISNN